MRGSGPTMRPKQDGQPCTSKGVAKTETWNCQPEKDMRETRKEWAALTRVGITLILRREGQDEWQGMVNRCQP